LFASVHPAACFVVCQCFLSSLRGSWFGNTHIFSFPTGCGGHRPYNLGGLPPRFCAPGGFSPPSFLNTCFSPLVCPRGIVGSKPFCGLFERFSFAPPVKVAPPVHKIWGPQGPHQGPAPAQYIGGKPPEPFIFPPIGPQKEWPNHRPKCSNRPKATGTEVRRVNPLKKFLFLTNIPRLSAKNPTGYCPKSCYKW